MVENQRANFRLEYPSTERPSLRIAKSQYEVLDLSERGVRFHTGPNFGFDEQSPIKGTIIFRDGKAYPIAGTVLRILIQEGQCVLSLKQGIPLTKMMEEHRNLLKKYKVP